MAICFLIDNVEASANHVAARPRAASARSRAIARCRPWLPRCAPAILHPLARARGLRLPRRPL